MVTSIVVQGDGKILLGGQFTQYNGTTRNGIARLNADGTLDTGFDPGSGVNGDVKTIILQSDGKILIGGQFTRYNGTARNRFARLNADGSLDTGFNPGTGADSYVSSMALQGDGRILIGGVFNQYNGTTRRHIARINTDGSLDTGFNPGSGANGEVYTIAMQTDNKILIGGVFGTYNGTTRNFLARLNINGSLDTGFNTGQGLNNVVTGLALQENNKIVVTGNFTSFNGVDLNRVARLNNVDGPAISGFSPVSSTVCVSGTATFTATIGNLTDTYSYTLTNGVTSITGTSGSNTFSQTLTAAGPENQAFTLTIQAGNGSTVAIAPLTVAVHPDYQLLADLYTNTNGADWTNKTGWLTDCNPCGWYGVTCTGGRVTKLGLGSNGLSGSIPASLSGLTSLQILSLDRNQLSGAIPESLGNLTSLQQLYLQNNRLSGCYETSLTALCGLQTKNFSENAGLPDGGSATAFTVFCTTGQGGNAFAPAATASLSAVCAGSVVSLSTAGGTSYNWIAPDGGILTGNGSSSVVSATLTTAGVQTFTAVVSQGGSCSQTATVPVTVNALPDVTITPPDATLTCASPTVTLLANGGDTYRWDDNSVSAARSVQLAGIYSVTATTPGGCQATASTTVSTNTAVIGVAIPLTTTAVTGSSFSQTFTATNGTGPYQFSVADGSVPAGLTLSAAGVLSGTPTQAGSYPVTVQAIDANGCQGTGTAYTLVISQGIPCGAVIYVTRNGAGRQDGADWDNAFSGTALQTAINTAATCGAQVWVAQGLYKPTLTSNQTISFSMRNNIAIYGGFAGHETMLSQRPAIGVTRPSSTTLSGDIDDNGELTNNSYHVISNPPGLTPGAVLDGFVITGGNAPDVLIPGGGMYNNGNGRFCNPTIRNCLFVGNASPRGGAIYNDGRSGACHPQISDCVFLNNSASQGGGAIWNAGNGNGNSSPQITNSLFQGNTAALVGGGAIYNDSEDPSISSPRLINCSFLNNSAVTNGGAICNGGIAGASNPQLTNCSFQGNSAPNGVIYSRSGRGGTANPQVINCVFFNNGSDNIFVNFSATVDVSYSLFGPNTTGYRSGPGNLITTTSPFAGTATTQLSGCSSALNAGLSSASGLSGLTTDLAGNPRFYNGGPVDMGAYEFQGTEAPATSFSVSGSGTATCAWSPVITLSGSETGVSYQLRRNGVDVGTAVAGTGSPVSFGNQPQSGTYTVAATRNGNPCTVLMAASATVESNTAVPAVSLNATATTLSCAVTSVTLTVASSATTLLWQDGSTAASLTANTAGTYSVSVTGTNGCTNSAATTLSGSTTQPALSLTALNACQNQGVSVSASPGFVSYTFVTPFSVTPASSRMVVINPPVSGPVIYTVTAENEQGCLATQTVSLTVYALLVASLTPGPSATLTCGQPSLTLTATGGGSYHFGGPGGIISQNPVAGTVIINQSGIYSVTVTDTNGCTALTSTTVTSTAAVISGSLVASGSISCNAPSVTLSASPSNLTYAFGSGAMQTGQTNQATVSAAGTYSVLISDADGCSALAQVTVTGSTTSPAGGTLTASHGGTLTCGQPSLTLTAGATGSGLRYALLGSVVPLQSGNSATVSAAGTYSVVITGSNGCSALAVTTVYSNTAVPTLNISPAHATLTCGVPVVSLSAIGTGNIYWSTNSVSPVISVSAAGVYSATLTDDRTGCSEVRSVTVGQVNNLTNLMASVAGGTGCGQASAQIKVSATGAESYTLLGPAGFMEASTSGVFVVTASGLYTALAGSPGACPVSATALVEEKGGQPVATFLQADGVLGSGSCKLKLQGAGYGNRFVITGPNGYVFSAVYRQAGTYGVEGPDVRVPGVYRLTVYNGSCSATYTTPVTGTACPSGAVVADRRYR